MIIQQMNSSGCMKCEFCADYYETHVGSCGCALRAAANSTCDDSLQMSEEEETWLVQTLATECNENDERHLSARNYQKEDNDNSQSGEFLRHLAAFLEKEDGIPFDLIDLWVPVLDECKPDSAKDDADNMKLCHAGHTVVANASNKNNKNGFGQYSIMFSFEPGHGLPGKIYTSGSPIWESDLPSCSYFERSYGAKKYGINTCLGLPVNSTIGRIVVVFYTEQQLSQRDEYLICRMQKSISSNWNPFPRWKLSLESGINDGLTSLKLSTTSPSFKPISDVPSQPVLQSSTPVVRKNQKISSSPSPITGSNNDNNNYIDFQIANLLAEQMPLDDSPLTSGFVSLRLLFLRSSHISAQEEEMLSILRKSYHGYKVVQRSPKDLALLLVQDYMFLETVFARHAIPGRSNTAVTVRSISYDVSTSISNIDSTSP